MSDANVSVGIDGSGAVKTLEQIKAAAEKLDVAFANLDRRLGSFAKGVDAVANAARGMDAAYGRVGRSVGDLGTDLHRLERNVASTETAFRRFHGHLPQLSRSITSTGAAIQGLAAAFGFRELLHANVALERFRLTLRASSPDVSTYESNLAAASKVANELGFSLGQIGVPFARFNLAATRAGFSAEESRGAFERLAGAARNFGLTSIETSGVVRALEQSLSKGKFMAEEVRLQLGDRLPVAMSALSDATGKSMAELNKMFEDGTLYTDKYFLPFIEALFKASGGQEQLALTTASLTTSVEKFKNAVFEAAGEVGDGGFASGVKDASDALTAFLRSGDGKQFMQDLGGMTRTAADAFILLAKNVEIAATVVGGLVLVRVGTWLVQAAQAAAAFGGALAGIAMAHPVLAATAAAIAAATAAAVYFRDATIKIGDSTTTVARLGVAAWESLISVIKRAGDWLGGFGSLLWSVATFNVSDIEGSIAKIQTAYANMGAAVRGTMTDVGKAVDEGLSDPLDRIAESIPDNTLAAGIDALLASLLAAEAPMKRVTTSTEGLADANGELAKRLAEVVKADGERLATFNDIADALKVETELLDLQAEGRDDLAQRLKDEADIRQRLGGDILPRERVEIERLLDARDKAKRGLDAHTEAQRRAADATRDLARVAEDIAGDWATPCAEYPDETLADAEMAVASILED